MLKVHITVFMMITVLMQMKYGNIGDDGKATQRSPPDNFTESKGFMRKSIAEVSKSVRPYFCLVLTSHIKQDWTK